MWNGEKCVILTSVVASGETGAEVIARWESAAPLKICKICDTARGRLPRVKAVSAPGSDIKVAVIKGEQLGNAARQMGLDEIVVMHKPFRDLGQYTVYLSVSYSISVKLQTQNDFWRHVWTNHHRYKIGFAFLAE